MDFRNKLIVTDLDGTFFDSKGRLVQKNLDAVDYFKQNGGLFAVATGRVPESMGTLAPIIDTLVNSPCICCNGAFAYDFIKHERIGQIELNRDKTVELIKRVRAEFPQVGIRISSTSGYLIANLNGYITRELADHAERLKANGLYHVNEVDLLPDGGWTRTAFCSDSGTLEEVRRQYENEYTEYFAFSKASPEIYEFQDILATKGTALDRLREFLVSSGKADSGLTVYALGDFENDLDLLKHCDIPACPANAIPAVQALAKLHLCHCDDGAVADLIWRIEAGMA